MSSFLRAGASAALAPVRRLSHLLSATLDTVSSTRAHASDIVRASVEFVRRDRTKPAAALLSLGPLLLDVMRDPATERAIRECCALLADALAVLQREEVRKIVLESLSLMQSRPVRDAVLHASGTLMALVHILQTPAVGKVRSQLVLYLSLVLGADVGEMRTHGSSTKGASARSSSSHSIDAPMPLSNEVWLSECVELMLIVEALSLPAMQAAAPLSSSSCLQCLCPSHLASVQLQSYFTPEEARRLRALVRAKDPELILLYRFQLGLRRQAEAEVRAAVMHASHSYSRARARTKGPVSQTRDHAPSRSVGASLDDSARILLSDDFGPSSTFHSRALASQARGTRPNGRRAKSADMIESELTAATRISAASMIAADKDKDKDKDERALQERLDRSEAEEHAPFAVELDSDSEDDVSSSEEEELSGNEEGRGVRSGTTSRSGHHSPSPDSAPMLPPLPPQCPHHVPVTQARFVFCVREMMADRQREELNSRR